MPWVCAAGEWQPVHTAGISRSSHLTCARYITAGDGFLSGRAVPGRVAGCCLLVLAAASEASAVVTGTGQASASPDRRAAMENDS